MDEHKRLRPSGGYRALRSFRATTVIYDATASFCGRFMSGQIRMMDQMVQAARSGRQNIAEGSRASAASSQTELRLINVARASLDELLLDYEDFLRQRGLRSWTKDDAEAREVRAIGKRFENGTDHSDASHYVRWLDHTNPEIVANAIICLIHQANYLLDRQIAALEKEFISGGGYSERLATARIEHRNASPEDALICCPACGKPMALRTARNGKNAGQQFWGCSGFPKCKATRKLD